MKVEIVIPEINKIATRTRIEGEDGLVTTIQFCARIPAAPIARLVNLQRQGAPLYVIIGSNQAMMDIALQEQKESQKEGETEVSVFPLT